MNKNFILEIIEKLKKKGCDQSDVFLVQSISRSSSVRLKALEKNESSQNTQIGIRVIKGKKQSMISSSNLELDNIDTLIQRVVDMVSVVPDNNYCGLAEKKLVKKFDYELINNLDLFDTYEPSIDELRNKATLLEDSALENKNIINSEGAEVSWTKSKYLLAGSNDMYQEFTKTYSSFILAILAGNGSGMEREYDYKSKVYFDELGDFRKIGEETAVKAIKKLNSKKIKTCKGDVIYDSRISSSLLRHLASAANAVSVARGTSFLKDKLGKKIFNKEINVIDNPRLPKMLNTKIIDCEGIETSAKSLIKHGELQFFFNSLESARQLNQKPTGHGTRGVTTLPSPSSSNLFLENGNISKENLIGGIKKGLLVTELMGTSINPSNGDYSRGASGFWVENGEITYPVSEITIAGNLFDIFSRLIPANDLKFDFTVNSPSCLVQNMTIAGI